MRYLIYTNGKVINQQGKSYVVNALTREAAQELAKEQFIDEYGCYNGEIYISKARGVDKTAIISMISMTIAILLSFINWKSGHSTISIKPDLISTVMAIIIYSAYVIRFKGLQRMTNYVDLIFLVLSVLLLSSFIQSILSSTEFKIPILGSYIDCRMLFVLAMLLSWMGIKILSIGCMAIIFLCGFLKIVSLNAAMGNIWGTVYAVCAAVGIILYLSVEPVIQEMLPYYCKCAQRTFMGGKSVVYDAGRDAQSVSNKLIDYGKQAISVKKNNHDKNAVSRDSVIMPSQELSQKIINNEKNIK